MNTKICSKCKTEKPSEEFWNQPDKKDGKCYQCKKCRAAAKRKSRLTHYHTIQQYNRKYKYHIEPLEHNILFKKQGGVCAICGKKETVKRNKITQELSVDHDHKTNKIRGLLCHSCNVGLGKFKDNPYLLQSAIDYLNNVEGEKNEYCCIEG